MDQKRDGHDQVDDQHRSKNEVVGRIKTSVVLEALRRIAHAGVSFLCGRIGCAAACVSAGLGAWVPMA